MIGFTQFKAKWGGGEQPARGATQREAVQLERSTGASIPPK